MVKTVLAVATKDSSGVLKKFEIERRDPEAKDVDIEIKYCGICHSDLHQIRAEWPTPSFYPMVPGHEIVGVVKSVGTAVTNFKPGDRVGVGVIVDSCRECAFCAKSLEQHCLKGMCPTYNAQTMWYGRSGPRTKVLPGYLGEIPFGGYSQSIVVDEAYVLKIPDGMDMAKTAPLLCAGVTTYSPLTYYGAKALGAACITGVVGFGGLGHMAVKIARAMGNTVIVFSTSPNKKPTVEAIGAKFVCTKNPEEMLAAHGLCNFMIDTVCVKHELGPYLDCLSVGGKLCLVGVPPENFEMHANQRPSRRLLGSQFIHDGEQVIVGKKTVCGSLIGGIKETQEMLDFCATHHLAADIILIHPKELNHAMVSLASNSNQVSRFVIDIESGLVPGPWEVEDDSKIDPKTWHAIAPVFPPSARHPAHANQGK